jgi:hypothetical protein
MIMYCNNLVLRCFLLVQSSESSIYIYRYKRMQLLNRR